MCYRINPADFQTMILNTLHHILECQLDSVFQKVLRDEFATTIGKSLSTDNYAKCIQGNKKHDNATSICLPILRKECKRSNIRVVKVIRLELKTIWQLLKLDPSIKVLHYTRDPRAIIHSRMNIKHSVNVTKEAATLCARMERDLEQVQKLQDAFPQSVLRLKYEDLALDPGTVSSTLYTMLGEQIPSKILKWLETHTKSGYDGKYGTSRNSQVALHKWERSMSSERRSKIESHCQTVIDKIALNSTHIT